MRLKISEAVLMMFAADPPDPYICYISKTVDHCIVKVNFHAQTISGVNYGPSNPLCQLFAGYERGQAHDGIGGYRNGSALDSMTGGVQQNDGRSSTVSTRSA